jgi:hypothetical protein
MNTESASNTPRRRPGYAILRPVSDLWIWWTVANGVAYAFSELTRLFFGNITLVSIAVSIIGTALTLFVLARYLAKFNWLGWIIATVVGALIGLAVGAIAGGILYYFIQQTTHQKSIADNFVSSLAFFGATDIAVSLVVAVGQWRILVDYAHWRDRGPWLLANLLAGIVGGVIFAVQESKVIPGDLSIVYGIISVTITSLIVGYALVRILQKYAPREFNPSPMRTQ